MKIQCGLFTRKDEKHVERKAKVNVGLKNKSQEEVCVKYNDVLMSEVSL